MYATIPNDTKFWIINKNLSKKLGFDCIVLLEVFAEYKYARTRGNDKWFTVFPKEIKNYAGISFRKQKKCIQKLTNLRLITREFDGDWNKPFYKINYENIEKLSKE